MDTTPEAPRESKFGPGPASLLFGAFFVWSVALVYLIWPSFRWQIEYFERPGPAIFYGILMALPLLALSSLLYSRFRGSRTIPWEPIVMIAPLLVLVLRQPWGAACAMLLLMSSLVLGRFVLVQLGLTERGAGQWAFPLLAGVSVWAWALSMIGLAGFLSQPLLWVAVGLPAVWAIKLAPEAWHSIRAAPSVWAADREVQSPLTGVLIPFLALALLSGVLVAAAPPVINDAVAFHLPLVQKWAQTGSLTPSFDHPYSFFPQSFEVLMAWAYSLGGAAAAQTFCFALSIVGLAMCWRLVRMLGGSQRTAAAALAIIASAPALHWTASVLKNDFLMASLQVGSAVCLLLWRADRNFRWILLGCWFLGSSFGVKHSALFGAVALGILMLHAVLQLKRRVAGLVAVAVILVLTASVWHVRTYLGAGDPAYPAGIYLISQPFDGSEERLSNPLLRVGRFLRQVHSQQRNGIFENVLPAPAGTLLALLFPLLFVGRRARWSGDRRAIGFVVAVATAHWLLTASNLRYGVTPLLLLACLLAIALSRACAEGSPAMQQLLSGVVVYGLLFGWTGSLIIENSAPQIRYAAGLMSADDYIAGVHPSLPAIRRLGQLAAPEDRVLAAGCCDPFYYPVSWKFDCSSERLAASSTLRMLEQTTYSYLIATTHTPTPALEANEVVYQDRACTVRRFLAPGATGQSAPAR